MTKQEYIEILQSLEIPINEGIQNDKNTDVYPRVVFWDIAWEDIMASNSEYDTKVTYQTSFFSRHPRDLKLIQLKKKLNEKGIGLFIQHEYIQDERYQHSYFAIEVLENINNELTSI